MLFHCFRLKSILICSEVHLNYHEYTLLQWIELGYVEQEGESKIIMGRKRERSKEAQFHKQITAISSDLYRLAYCYVKHEQQALDIVSKATYKGYLNFMRTNRSLRFDYFMLRMTIDTANEEMYDRNPEFFMEVFMQGQDDSTSGRGIAIPRGKKVDVYTALDYLRPEEQTCMILKYFVGLSFTEIAEVLSLPEHIVKHRWERIIQQLSVYLIEGEIKLV